MSAKKKTSEFISGNVCLYSSVSRSVVSNEMRINGFLLSQKNEKILKEFKPKTKIFYNVDILKSVCTQYHSRIGTLEEQKYDFEYKVATKDMEARNYTKYEYKRVKK